jgi:hypothetical protein
MGGKTYLNRREVRKRYGNISNMTLWRWERDKRLNFPKPSLEINGRGYHEEDSLDQWDCERALVSARRRRSDYKVSGSAPAESCHVTADGEADRGQVKCDAANDTPADRSSCDSLSASFGTRTIKAVSARHHAR